jgi:Signal transduction histidine kinase
MMKFFKTEIQVIILNICIGAVVIVSGKLAYESLAQIVETIHNEARPDLTLLTIKDITSDLNQVENSIRLYSLTGNGSFLRSYRQLGDSIQKKLKTLSEYALPGSEEISHIDSISMLTKKKLVIWDQIRSLHRSKTDAHKSFTDLYSKIDTAYIQPDTIRFKPEPKKSFFKRLFGKRDTTTKRPIIIDKSKDKEVIKKEIAGIEEQITTQAKNLQTKETDLFKLNIKVTRLLNRNIAALELSGQEHFAQKTQEADALAAQTNERMKYFSIATVILLLTTVVLIIRNLQKNKKYQKALNQAKTEAESLAKAKEMFVATVSHEMRTPINAIYGLTGQMLKKAEHSEAVNDLKVVHRSAEHLIALVNDTLDFSKIESQKMKIEQVDFIPSEIVSEIFILHKDQAQNKGIELAVNSTVPDDLILIGDPIRLKQILINLITNALKFTNNGQVSLTVSGQKTSPSNFTIHAEVADTGVGISAEDLPLIFEEFVQLGTDLKQKQRGAGLGLSIVKKLIQLQDGRIDVQSTPGKGTTFIVEIPYKTGNSENIAPKQEPKLQIPQWFAKLSLLVVDDEEFNRYVIQNILRNWGVSFEEAVNGQEAVALSRQKKYDLILMDIRMPVMDGYEATEFILKSDPNQKIVALTASSKSAEIQKIQNAGMSAFLQKPFSEEDFIKIIVELLPATSEPEPKLDEETETSFNLNELELMASGDKAFFNEMLQIFIRSSEESMAKFQTHILAKEWQSIAEVAHKLAAPAKHMQAISLYDKLKTLENQIENLPEAEIGSLVKSIEGEISQINEQLRNRINES